MREFVRCLILLGRKQLSDGRGKRMYPFGKKVAAMALIAAVFLPLPGDCVHMTETAPVIAAAPHFSLFISYPFHVTANDAAQLSRPGAAPTIREEGALIMEGTDEPELEPQPFPSINTAALDHLLASFGEGVSVYYKNLASGFEYVYNGDERYFAASVIKAPYVLYVYTLAQEGKADLNESIVYGSRFYAGGTGEIKNKQTGTAFTVQELLSYAIRYSDNIALRMLMDRYSTDEFAAYAAEWGGNADAIGNVTGADMTAREAGLYAERIYRFIEEGDANGRQFKDDLMSTRHPMIRSSYPIARKYGWANRSFHDMAIVYAPSPYILAVLSDHDSGSPADYAMFTEISEVMERFSLAHFAGG